MSAHIHYCPECKRKILCAVDSCEGKKHDLCGTCGAKDLGQAVNPIDRFDEQQESILFPYVDFEA